MIHYSEFAARRASAVPLLGAIASLAAIAVWLGEPQVVAGAGPANHGPVTVGPAIAAPERWNDEPSVRVRTSSAPPQVASSPSGPAGVQQTAVALFNRDRVAALLPELTEYT